jgi:chromate transporter
MSARDDTAPAAPQEAAGAVSLPDIMLLFGRVGLTSFGGGLSAWIYREVVSQRNWLSDEEFLGALTLSQILPGSNVINLSIYVGQRLRGPLGSVTAVAALLLPPMALIVLLASVFHRFTQLVALHDFLEGVAVAAIGMTASVGLKTARSAVATRRWPLLLIAVVFVAVGVLHWPLVPVALAVAACGLTLAWRMP